MNPSIRCILFFVMAVILLLPACAPAPAATQDPTLVHQLIEQSVATAVAAQKVQANDQHQLIEQYVASTVAAQATDQQVQFIAQATLTPTATPFVLTPQPAESNAATAATFDPNAPVVESISPNNGLTTGGSTVTITGINFIVGKGHIDFKFGDISATDVICQSTTQCTAKIPPLTGGTVTVRAVLVGDNLNGNNKTDEFTYKVLNPDAPVVESISPQRGPIGGGTIVTITGRNFTIGENTHFYFGDNDATQVICESQEKCSAKSPPGKEGTVTVEAAILHNGQELTSQHIGNNKTDGFIYTAQLNTSCVVLTVSPKNLTVFKKGEGFDIKWIVVNKGGNKWRANTDIKFSEGINMSDKTFVEIPVSMKPNDTYDITIHAVAPSNPGKYYMTWIIEDQGCSAYIAINVE